MKRNFIAICTCNCHPSDKLISHYRISAEHDSIVVCLALQASLTAYNHISSQVRTYRYQIFRNIATIPSRTTTYHIYICIFTDSEFIFVYNSFVGAITRDNIKYSATVSDSHAVFVFCILRDDTGFFA